MCFFAVGSSFDALEYRQHNCSFRSRQRPRKMLDVPYEPRATVGESAILLPGAEVVSTYRNMSPSSSKQDA